MNPRETLLERVIEHVAANGLADQSLRELAAGAGTSHRMLLYHFGSRAGLVAAIAARIEEQQRETLVALAAEAAGPADLQRRLWAQVSDPAIAPFVRLFFDVLGLALADKPGTERFRAELIEPWLARATQASEAVGVVARRDELRLGVAVTRGLLIDLLATGDLEGTTAAHERFIALWELSRTTPPTAGGPMPPTSSPVHRLAAFTEHPDGGNPAGVVVSDTALAEAEMQRLAADVGYSETAFLYEPTEDRRSWRVRYFSPVAEVPFCGHATIAAGVVLGDRVGTGGFTLHTIGGAVPVEVARTAAGLVATLTSVTPEVQPAPDELVSEVMDAAGIDRSRLDGHYPPAVSFAGARHLLLVLADRTELRKLTYDFDRVLAAMTAHELTTVAYLWPAADGVWHARNLFPVGGVVEDPATGAAAAAFGAYLRSIGAIATPGHLDIVQGEDLGRTSHLHVTVPPAPGGIDVSGGAVPIPDEPGH